jgi:E3 ubiquitin-protein ligase DOA10
VSKNKKIENDENEFTCRICLEEGRRNELIAPCSCSGTQKWVHRACLDQWRTAREDKAFSSCTECKAHYKLICKSTESPWQNFSKTAIFALYVSRDCLVVLTLTQLIILFFSYLIYV